MNKRLLVILLFLIFGTNLFASKYISVKYQEKYVLLDQELNIVLEPVYKNITILNDYIFVDDGKYCLVFDSDVRFVSKIKIDSYRKVFHLYDDFYCIDTLFQDVIYNPKTGYLNKLDVKLSKIYFDSGTEELLPVFNGYYIDIDGNTYFRDYDYQSAYPFINGKAVVLQNNWNKGIIDKTGKIIFDNIINCGWQFKDGFLPVITKTKSGFINENCEFVFECPIVDELKKENVGGRPTIFGVFSEGYAYVHVAEKIWRIYDSKGRNVSGDLAYVSESQVGFQNGLLPVSFDGKYGYVNTKGEIVIPLELDYAEDFCNGFAYVIYQGNESVITSDGRVYQIKKLLQNDKESIKILK